MSASAAVPRLPYMPWYPEDFRRDTAHLPPLARCLYHDLLDACWMSGMRLKWSDGLYRLVGFTREEFEEAWALIQDKWTIDAKGFMHNAKLVRVHASALGKYLRKQRQASEAGKASAAKRKLLKDKANSTTVQRSKYKPTTPSEYVGLSTALALDKAPESDGADAEEFDAANVEMPGCEPREPCQRWVEHRRDLGRRWTPAIAAAALDRLVELHGQGHPPDRVIAFCLQRGWLALDPPPAVPTRPPVQRELAMHGVVRTGSVDSGRYPPAQTGVNTSSAHPIVPDPKTPEDFEALGGVAALVGQEMRRQQQLAAQAG